MSGSNRSNFLAIVTGLGIAFALGAMATTLDYHGDYQERYPRYANTPDDAKPRSLSPGVGAPSYKVPCESPQGHDESDLCAQWRAANGAKQGARWNLWQLVLGFCGLIGLGITLSFNKRAIDLALAGTEDTERALKIAEDNARANAETVAETRRIGEAQIRCYLTGVSAQVGFTNSERAMVKCMVRNSGKSPAMDVQCVCRLYYDVGENGQDFEKIDENYPRFEVDIASETTEEISCCLCAEGYDLSEHPEPGEKVFISLFVTITAIDVFKLPVTKIDKFVAFLDDPPVPGPWINLARAARLSKRQSQG
jgi:hypothetical protein